MSSQEYLGMRYLRVANTLRRRIVSGLYRTGQRLPGQHDLARQYNVAFNTLQHALDVLEEEGYVVRKVGQGTYASRPQEHAPTALVVDDEEGVTKLMATALRRVGWNSLCVTSGSAALAALKEQRFDVIFLDLVLPGLHGADTFREIRRIDPAAKVVIVTGYPDSDIMARALAVGPFAVINKPFTPAELYLVLGDRPWDSRMSPRRQRGRPLGQPLGNPHT